MSTKVFPKWPTPRSRAWLQVPPFAGTPFPYPGAPPCSCSGQQFAVGAGTFYPIPSIPMNNAWRYWFGVGRVKVTATITGTPGPMVSVNADGSGTPIPCPLGTADSIEIDTPWIPYGANYLVTNSPTDSTFIAPDAGVYPVGAAVFPFRGKRWNQIAEFEDGTVLQTYPNFGPAGTFNFYKKTVYYQTDYSGFWFPYVQQGSMGFSLFSAGSIQVSRTAPSLGSPSGLLRDPLSTGNVYLALQVSCSVGNSVQPWRNPRELTDPLYDPDAPWEPDPDYVASPIGCTFDGESVPLWYNPNGLGSVETPSGPVKPTYHGSISIQTQNLGAPPYS